MGCTPKIGPIDLIFKLDLLVEFLPCQFSDPERPNPDIYIEQEKLVVSSRFKYLGSVINNKASCDDDIKHRTSVGWMKWRQQNATEIERQAVRNSRQARTHVRIRMLDHVQNVRE